MLRYLLRRLLQYEAASSTASDVPRQTTLSAALAQSQQHTAANAVAYQLLPGLSAASSSSSARPSSQSIAQLLGEVDKRRKKSSYKKRPMTEDRNVIKGCRICLFVRKVHLLNE